ncbi:hypothetical protein WN943_003718 [Citrus x changshan-huyou]
MATGWCAVAVTSMGPRLWWGGSRVMTVVPAVAKEAARVVWRLEDNKRKLFCFGAVAWSRVGPREGATSFRRSQQRPKSRQHRTIRKTLPPMYLDMSFNYLEGEIPTYLQDNPPKSF